MWLRECESKSERGRLYECRHIWTNEVSSALSALKIASIALACVTNYSVFAVDHISLALNESKHNISMVDSKTQRANITSHKKQVKSVLPSVAIHMYDVVCIESRFKWPASFRSDDGKCMDGCMCVTSVRMLGLKSSKANRKAVWHKKKRANIIASNSYKCTRIEFNPFRDYSQCLSLSFFCFLSLFHSFTLSSSITIHATDL